MSTSDALKRQVEQLENQLVELELAREESSELKQLVERQEAELSASRREVGWLQQDIRLREKYLTELAEREKRLRAELRARDESLTALQSSPSWRITSPLRSLAHQLRRLLGRRF